jgi:aminoglycoside phosphotransferase (APT) family kinase protein
MSEGDVALREGLARWLAQRQGVAEVEIADLHRPTAGYSSETIFVDASWPDGATTQRSSLVIRMATAQVGTFPNYNLVAQGQAQAAVAAVGVPVADPVVVTDLQWVGAPFMVMTKVEGHIIGAMAHRDPWIRECSPPERTFIYDGMLSAMASVHRADPILAPEVPRRDLSDELAFWDEYLSWSNHGRPVPALTTALEWCHRHQPADEPPSALLWGDARLENVVFGDDFRARAILDWDMTTIGAPEHDLAWFTSLDFTMHQLFGKRTEGFPDRPATITRFEELMGRPVRDLEWYETLAMVRSTAIMTRISVLRQDAGQPLMAPIEDNPVLDLLLGRLT